MEKAADVARAGNSADSKAIADELERQRAAGPPDDAREASSLDGTWHFITNGGYQADLVIDSNDVFHVQARIKTKAVRRGDQFLLRWPDGNVDRCTVVGDTMFLEHWKNGSRPGTTRPVNFGRGERVNK